MIVARTWAVAALLVGVIGIAVSAAAGTKYPTIFVANGYDVTAYPARSTGDVAPIALTTDTAAPNGVATDSSGRIYVTNGATNTVTVYAADANGNVPPIAVIGGSKTRLANPNGIALDASGKIYVLNSMNYSNGSITVYPPLDAGTGILNEAPIAVIAGSKTRLDNAAGITLDSKGNIYVANGLRVRVRPDQSYDSGRLTVYRAESNGNVAPIATISGHRTGLAYPVGIALDSGGNIYVANYYTANTRSDLKYDSSITVYPAGSNGNAPPSAVIAGDNTGLSYPQGIALDSSGNLYAEGYGNGVGYSVNVYPEGSNGNVSPSASIAGADTGMDGPFAIALDSSGNIYVLNSYGGTAQLGSVTAYPAGSSGDTVPTATITSNFTRLPFASGIAVDSPGNIYVTNTLSGAGEDFSIEIYPAGSYATGPPIATIAGDDTGLYFPFGIALDSSGNISVLNRSVQNRGGTVTVYPAGSAGDAMPNAMINIDTSGKNSPTGVAVNPGGDLYVANQGGVKCDQQSCFQTSLDSVAVYPAGSDGDAKPSAVISGGATNLASPSAIAVDHTGRIYVTNEGIAKCMRGCGQCIPIPAGPGSVSVYGPGSKGDVMPLATISGPNTGLRFPYEIAVDSSEKIYVLNSAGIGFACSGIVKERGAVKVGVPKAGIFADRIGDPILIFAAGSNGDVAPIGTIGGPYTGLYGPVGIAVGPAGP